MKERIKMGRGKQGQTQVTPPPSQNYMGKQPLVASMAPPKYVHGNDEGLIIELLLLMSFYPPPVGGGDRSRILSHVSPGRRPA